MQRAQPAVTPVEPTNPTEPTDPAVDPADGNAADDGQGNTQKVPQTGDNMLMEFALYAFLAVGAVLGMRKIKKEA